MDIKRIFIAILLICAIGVPVYGASVGKQVDFLAAGLEQDDAALSGGKVYTYEALTTTAKACYTDRAKTTPETNPIKLDSEGRTTAFCDGVYTMVIKDSAEVTLITMDGISYGEEGAQFTTLSSYSSLAEAVADIGGTKTVLIIDTTDTLNENVTVPTNITLVALERDALTLNSKTLTMNGDIWAGAFEWIIGTGIFAGSPVVQFYDPTWTASTVTDSATPSYKNLTISEPTLLTPVVADFSNSTHAHISNITGGTLQLSAIRDTSRGLFIVNSSEEVATITADEAILQNASGLALTASSISETASMIVNGAGGLYNGTEAADTWYYIWLIANSTDTAGLISNSASSPVLPDGYTYKGLFGAVYNDSGEDFEAFSQVDNMVQAEQVTLYDQTDFSTACISNDISANVPESAKSLTGVLYGLPTATNAGQLGIWGNSDCLGGAFLHFETATRNSGPFRIPIEGQTIYLKAFQTGGSFSDANVFFTGWGY